MTPWRIHYIGVETPGLFTTTESRLSSGFITGTHNSLMIITVERHEGKVLEKRPDVFTGAE
jgi:hypothetical protein